jgi:hypothetical protein
MFDGAMNWEQDPKVLDSAREHALKAVDLDGSLVLAHALLGWVQLWHKQGGRRDRRLPSGSRIGSE